MEFDGLSRRNLFSTLFLLSLCVPSCVSGCGSHEDQGASSFNDSLDGVPYCPKGKIRWTAELDAIQGSFAQPSIPVVVGSLVYVPNGGGVAAYDVETGCRKLIGESAQFGVSGIRSAVCGDLLLVAFGNGALAAYRLDDLSIAWRAKFDLAEAEVFAGHHIDDATGEQIPEYSRKPALWNVTDILIHDDRAFVGFSSFQTDPGSYLICTSIHDGEVCWTRGYPGRFCFNGGASCPQVAQAGLLVPVPESCGFELLSFEDGSALDQFDMDAPVGTGFAALDSSGESFMFQTRSGDLHVVEISGEGLDVSKVYSAAEYEGQMLLPNSALPVLCAGWIYCNASVEAHMGEDGFLHAQGAGGLIAVERESGRAIRSGEGYRFDSTPVVVRDRETDGLLLLCLQEDCLQSVNVDGGIVESVKTVSEEAALSMDGINGPCVFAGDGVMLCVAGDTAGRILVALD